MTGSPQPKELITTTLRMLGAHLASFSSLLSASPLAVIIERLGARFSLRDSKLTRTHPVPSVISDRFHELDAVYTV